MDFGAILELRTEKNVVRGASGKRDNYRMHLLPEKNAPEIEKGRPGAKNSTLGPGSAECGGSQSVAQTGIRHGFGMDYDQSLTHASTPVGYGEFN